MVGKRNNVIPNGHFHKDWQRYVRTWFNQPTRHIRRHRKRLEKAKRIFPRPVAGFVRPIVRCPTFKYNTKQRLGRGFSLDELKAAGIPKTYARKIGIAVDHRRTNRSVEGLQENVQRLKEYQSRLILWPTKAERKRNPPTEAQLEEMRNAKQIHGKIMPIKQKTVEYEARVPTEAEKKFSPYRTMRVARYKKKQYGRLLKKSIDAEQD